MDSSPHPSSLWRDRSFVLYWFATATSVAGSAITAVVLPILVFQLTGSALNTALLAGLEVIPYLLFGLLAGAVADRAKRKTLIVLSDVLNALLLASIPLAAAFGLLTLPHIYVVAFLSAVAFVWGDAAHFGALPTLVGGERITEANSIIVGTATTIGIVAPAIGAYLATRLGAANAISLDALSYALSAVTILLIPKALSGSRQTSTTSPLKTIRSDIKEGLTFLWNHKLVRTMTLLGFGVSFSGGAVFGLIVVFAVRVLGLGNDDPKLGWFFSAGAMGALLTSLVLPRLKFSPQRIYLVGIWLDVGLLVLFVLSNSFYLSLVLYCLWNAVHTLIIINGISLRQRVTPEPLQSRVNAAGRMIAWGGTPFGAVVAGVLADAYGVRVGLLVTALAVFIAAGLALVSPLRQAGSS
jgi:MFS family permease